MRTSLMHPFHRLRSNLHVVQAHLPALRRHAGALSGSQQSADAHMAAMTDILTMDERALPDASTSKVALFKLYTQLYARLFNLEDPAQTRARQILLLVLIEGFSNREAAEILDTGVAEIVLILRSAGCTKPETVRTSVMAVRGKGRPGYRAIRGPSLQAAC